jgi:hypothetical protein
LARWRKAVEYDCHSETLVCVVDRAAVVVAIAGRLMGRA